jgi:hypothetical protein
MTLESLKDPIQSRLAALATNEVRLKTWQSLNLNLLDGDDFFIELFNFERKELEFLIFNSPMFCSLAFDELDMKTYTNRIDEFKNKQLELRSKIADYQDTFLSSCSPDQEPKILAFISRLTWIGSQYASFAAYYQYLLDFATKDYPQHYAAELEKVAKMVKEYRDEADKKPLLDAKKHVEMIKSFITQFLFQPPLVKEEDSVKRYIGNSIFLAKWKPNEFVNLFYKQLNQAFGV